MKKLLCVLMFGMVFGQTELTTRVYGYNISLQENELYDFTEINLVTDIKTIVINPENGVTFDDINFLI